jgi:pimeloyl-ACP methyl ester carboxylesterase
MRTLVHEGAPGAPRRAIALLNGTYSEPEDFARHGFIEAAVERGCASEIIAAELRAAWFADGSIVERIREHIVRPARARGHEKIWLGGISLGALSALAYAARNEADLEGVILLSPYPAARDVLHEIESAGGLARWRPAAPHASDLEREAWRWLARGRPALPVHCWFGREDRFLTGQRRLAEALDPELVHECAGGHDWKAWSAYWAHFLDESRLVLQ